MTTAITRVIQQDLVPSVPELALQLIAERPPMRRVADPHRSRDYEKAIYPRLTNAQRSALTQGLAALQGVLMPSPRAQIIRVLARLVVHYPREKSQQEWQMQFEDLAEDLAPFSAAHVQEAIKEHRRSKPFYPKSSELHARCLELVERDEFRLKRCERLLADD